MTAKLAALALSLAALMAAAPAHAEDGAWKVGSSYVIRFEQLDLSQPTDRQALLKQVERSATRLCEAQRTRARKERCAASAIKTTLDRSPSEVRSAVSLARVEREGSMQAAR